MYVCVCVWGGGGGVSAGKRLGISQHLLSERFAWGSSGVYAPNSQSFIYSSEASSQALHFLKQT